MKTIKYLLSVIFLSLINNVFAQNDTIPHWSYELEGKAYQDWDSIYTIWKQKVYSPCLKENKLKMSCSGCESIYIDAIFTIDSSGKVANIQIIKENICFEKATEKLKQCFFNYFKVLVFPESLRFKKIKARFGTGLKC